ncbi:MAG: pyridoxal phosphate-dependent aminotransferase [Candidatus Omnitrophica bacterium]|nr:pyridoxal phosphate-dependent aminotransferase [Candidatus Omnitrophota bacterium]
MLAISKIVSQIKPSATLAITAKAKKMKQDGVDVIGFGAGEPDFDTPLNIKEAAKKALDNGFTKYTPASGIPELKEAIAKKLKKDNNLHYLQNEIVVSCGAKHSIFNAVFALCNEGDEVILPSPYWVSYAEIVKIAGAVPIIIKTTEERNFKITLDDLKKAVTPRTKLFILNSPSNPTGMVYDEEELKELSKVISDAGIYCISDEIYEKIIYDGMRHVSIASFGEKIKKLTIVINGVSKSHSMTGWRIGYAAGPKNIIQAISNLQSHTTSNPVSFSQLGAVEALEGPQEETARMIKEFKKRRDYMVDKINSIKGLSVAKPQGAFYCFVNISNILGKGKGITDSLKLADTLLTEAKVAVVPGIAFGDDNFMRLSYATSMENIKEGLNRMEKWIKNLQG